VFDAVDAPWCDFYLKALGHILRVHASKPGEEVILPASLKSSQGQRVRGGERGVDGG
jgi:hypothetical protein